MRVATRRVGNGERLLCIPTASAAALNGTVGLSTQCGMDLHANLRAALWPADNWKAEHGERSQRFSPGLQLSWLRLAIHNRLTAGLKRLKVLCVCCVSCCCNDITARKVIKLCKRSLKWRRKAQSKSTCATLKLPLMRAALASTSLNAQCTLRP